LKRESCRLKRESGQFNCETERFKRALRREKLHTAQKKLTARRTQAPCNKRQRVQPIDSYFSADILLILHEAACQNQTCRQKTESAMDAAAAPA
jgi:hypothetical protein